MRGGGPKHLPVCHGARGFARRLLQKNLGFITTVNRRDLITILPARGVMRLVLEPCAATRAHSVLLAKTELTPAASLPRIVSGGTGVVPETGRRVTPNARAPGR